MRRFDVKSEENMLLDANKRGKGFVVRNNIWREALAGTSEVLNALQVKFYCGGGDTGGPFSECIRLKTAYLSTKLKGGGDVETLIRDGKLFQPAWTDPVRPKPAATKAMLQAEYRTRAKRVDKLRTNLRTAYGLVLGQCTDYLRSCLGGQERWEKMSNKQDLLELIKSIKSLSHKYDKDTY